VTDDPQVMAEAILNLLADDDAWRRQSVQGAAYAQARFSRQALRACIDAAMRGPLSQDAAVSPRPLRGSA